MAWVTINGIDATPAWADRPKTTPEVVGSGVTRAFSGAARSSNRGFKGHLSFRTIALPLVQALALEGLAKNDGEQWNLDGVSAYGSKGGAITATAGVTYINTAPLPGNGLAKYAKLATSGTDTLQVPLAYSASGGWTVGVSRLEAGVWNEYIIHNDIGDSGAVKQWKNGVLQGGGLPTWLTVTNAQPIGNVLITARATPDDFSDLLVYPFNIGQTYAPQLSTYHRGSAAAWPAPPRCVVGGDLYPATRKMMGKPGTNAYEAGAIPGSAFTATLRSVLVELLEA